MSVSLRDAACELGNQERGDPSNFADGKLRSDKHLQLKCVDLFAGAGGFSLAAKLAGFGLKLAIENNKHACNTYRHNLCRDKKTAPRVYESDIESLTASEVVAECFDEAEGCDLLLGGPPCQGFSTHRIRDAGVADPRNSLIHTYFEFVAAFQPTAFLMENVPGMLWPRHSAYVNRFYEMGKSAGYHVFRPVILDARDYGVPQRRKRVFILGVKERVNLAGLEWPPAPTHINPSRKHTAKALKSWVPCAQVFKNLPKDDENAVFMKHGAELREAFRKTPKNGGSREDAGRTLKCHESHNGHKDVYGRIDPRHPAPTMTTACINPSKGRFVHPRKNHGITIREAARLQGFPDSFVFKGGLMAAGAQIGNAVPIELAKKLLSHLSPLLQKSQRILQTPADNE